MASAVTAQGEVIEKERATLESLAQSLRDRGARADTKVIWGRSVYQGLLHEARESRADLLVVGLNSDAGVRTLKGGDRPVNDEQARAAVLNALAAVDFVAIFDELTPLELIREVRPDVLVKGSDYHRDEVVGGVRGVRDGAVFQIWVDEPLVQSLLLTVHIGRL